MIPMVAWMCESGRMTEGIEVRLRPGERKRLEDVVAVTARARSTMFGVRVSGKPPIGEPFPM